MMCGWLDILHNNIMIKLVMWPLAKKDLIDLLLLVVETTKRKLGRKKERKEKREERRKSSTQQQQSYKGHHYSRWYVQNTNPFKELLKNYECIRSCSICTQ